MQSQVDNDRLAVRTTNLISVDRPDTSQLVDLHVYIIPKSVWKNGQNLAENETMEKAISAGFVRAPQNMNIHDLRQHILDVCGQDEQFPKEFVYLRSVGRCLTKVKPQQETELRVKNYRPPTTFAPEIYVLEGHHDEDSLTSAHTKSYLLRESPIRQAAVSSSQSTSSRQASWIKPSAAPPIPPLPPLTIANHPSAHSADRANSTNLSEHATALQSNLSIVSSTLSARDLAKLREEQERLRIRQMELARQRREIEQEQQKRERKLLEKQEYLSREQREKEEQAAIRIQESYRNYRNRRILKEQQQRQISNFANYRGLWSPEPEDQRIGLCIEEINIYSTPIEKTRGWETEHLWSATSSIESKNNFKNKSDADQPLGFSSFRHAASEIERLQREARELARRKAEEEHVEELNAHDVVKLSDQLEQLKAKRTQLEATRETVIHRMQQLHAQIAVRRKEERDLWKQKYLIEKKKTAALEERGRMTLKDQSDVDSQLEEAKIRLNNCIKLRQEAENQCQLLRQELQQIRLNMTTLETSSFPKHPSASHHDQHQIPISVDITLQY